MRMRLPLRQTMARRMSRMMSEDIGGALVDREVHSSQRDESKPKPGFSHTEHPPALLKLLQHSQPRHLPSSDPSRRVRRTTRHQLPSSKHQHLQSHTNHHSQPTSQPAPPDPSHAAGERPDPIRARGGQPQAASRGAGDDTQRAECEMENLKRKDSGMEM